MFKSHFLMYTHSFFVSDYHYYFLVSAQLLDEPLLPTNIRNNITGRH